MSGSFMLILAVLNNEFDVNLKIIIIYKNNPVVVNDMQDHIFLPKTQAFKCKIQVHIILLILVTIFITSLTYWLSFQSLHSVGLISLLVLKHEVACYWQYSATYFDEYMKTAREAFSGIKIMA